MIYSFLRSDFCSESVENQSLWNSVERQSRSAGSEGTLLVVCPVGASPTALSAARLVAEPNLHVTDRTGIHRSSLRTRRPTTATSGAVLPCWHPAEESVIWCTAIVHAVYQNGCGPYARVECGRILPMAPKLIESVRRRKTRSRASTRAVREHGRTWWSVSPRAPQQFLASRPHRRPSTRSRVTQYRYSSLRDHPEDSCR